jgi:hypothetical protein
VKRLSAKLISKGAIVRLGILAGILGLAIAWGWFAMLRMPGNSYDGELPPLTPAQNELADVLRQDVTTLAEEIGIRNYSDREGLNAAVKFIETEFARAGYAVERQEYDINGEPYANIVVEIPGTERPDEIVVVGAHYDSVFNSPAANDNGSGVAATLALARRFAGVQGERTLRFVAFANEEPPFFQTEDMGSLVYAKRCRDRDENIVVMLSLETIGYYSDKVGSQNYPAPLNLFYPMQGNFIAFVGNIDSGEAVREVVGTFRDRVRFPSEGAALPNLLPGVGWSDHWAFWQQGYRALMVTDTAPFRYPYYHTLDDTPDKLDYERFARVVDGLEPVVAELIGVEIGR